MPALSNRLACVLPISKVVAHGFPPAQIKSREAQVLEEHPPSYHIAIVTWNIRQGTQQKTSKILNHSITWNKFDLGTLAAEI